MKISVNKTKDGQVRKGSLLDVVIGLYWALRASVFKDPRYNIKIEVIEEPDNGEAKRR